jgi:FKBP-type peptidyl-prolyl cis-trans isomerase
MKRLFLLLATITLAGCGLESTGPANNPTDPATETFASSLGIDLSTMTETSSGDYYKDLTVGTGNVINGDAIVAFTYSGYLKDGTQFQTGAINLSDNEAVSALILGMQDDLQGMRVGGRRQMVIPSEFGYGNATVTGVPPNSTLIFDVTLTAITAVP